VYVIDVPIDYSDNERVLNRETRACRRNSESAVHRKERAMLKDTYPYYLANEAVYANTDLEVTDKFSGKVATRVALADAQAIDAAIGAAVDAVKPMRELPAYRRQAVLDHCVARFRERFDELAEALCIEAGKPINDSRGEVTRLIDTFRVASEEAVRIDGEVLNLEISARAQGYTGYTRRVPIGPCSFISPFNFPLNLAAHKVAPRSPRAARSCSNRRAARRSAR
jgi:acyl-CoA reductase-like NAD-dependent aldehyde dehydrogenase